LTSRSPAPHQGSKRERDHLLYHVISRSARKERREKRRTSADPIDPSRLGEEREKKKGGEQRLLHFPMMWIRPYVEWKKKRRR